MAFAHLHVHTEYSTLDGMIRIGDGFRKAAEMGQTALATTDHGNLGAAWAAQKEADKAGIKYIAGCEFYLSKGPATTRRTYWVPPEDHSTDEDTERSEDETGELKHGSNELGLIPKPYRHLTVIARDETGWRNLVTLNNLAYDPTRIWRKPRIDYDLLAEHGEGLIVLTGCLGGPVLGPLAHAHAADTRAEEARQQEAAALAAADADAAGKAHRLATLWSEYAQESRDDARSNIRTLIEAVGRENVYVEIMEHGIAHESVIIPQAVELAREMGVGIVATNDAHHTHAEDAEAHAAWLLVQSKSTLSNPKYQFDGHGFHLRTEDEMRALRPEPWWQEACDTTQVIADRCAARVVPGWRNLMPAFPTPEGFASNREYLYHLMRKGAQRIYGGITAEVRDRVRTEMEVIEESGFIDYFLVVEELVTWCNTNGILTGPGRGSAGGSMVAYLLGITRIDPIRYQLLFERFLERGRTEPPDIDIDFPQSRRADVIQHLVDQYGKDNVALIGTYQVARTKAAIKSAARVLEAGGVGEQLAKVVPIVEAKPMATSKLLDATDPQTEAYRKVYDKEEAAPRIHQLASAFEDVISGQSIHASGVIVSAVPLNEVVPLRYVQGRGWALQWTGPEAEGAGLLKVDVLGLRNLDIVTKSLEYIEKQTGEVLDPYALPDPDFPEPHERARVDAAYRTIAEGRTSGLFQLESPAMTELAMSVAPRNLNDLSALVALFRPGPMGMGLHTSYADLKRDPSKVSYDRYTVDQAEAEQIASVLGDTYSLMTYQEQVMLLGTVVAGFDAALRSKLRKAVSKKKKDLMDEVGKLFFEGAPMEVRDEQGNIVSIPFAETTARRLWDEMVTFAEYAFNRSHSATYGYLAYITAYLKGNWPSEFAAATLAVTSGTDKRMQVIRGLDREGITVLAPDVNAGNADTAPVDEHHIRFGLAEVKGVGQAGYAIEADYQRSGAYGSILELQKRVMKQDEHGGVTQASAIDSKVVRALIEAGALDRFGTRLGLLAVSGAAKSVNLAAPELEWGVLERAARQRTVLGLTVGEHPLHTLKEKVENYRIPVGDMTPAGQARLQLKPVQPHEVPDESGALTCVIGILAGWSEKSYSKGRLANIRIEGVDGSISATLFDDTLTAVRDGVGIPKVGDVVTVSGRVRFREIEADPDDPEATDQRIKEITANMVSPVRIDDPRRGGWRPAPDGWPGIDFTIAPAAAEPAATVEPESLFELDEIDPEADPEAAAADAGTAVNEAPEPASAPDEDGFDLFDLPVSEATATIEDYEDDEFDPAVYDTAAPAVTEVPEQHAPAPVAAPAVLPAPEPAPAAVLEPEYTAPAPVTVRHVAADTGQWTFTVIDEAEAAQLRLPTLTHGNPQHLGVQSFRDFTSVSRSASLRLGGRAKSLFTGAETWVVACREGEPVFVMHYRERSEQESPRELVAA